MDEKMIEISVEEYRELVQTALKYGALVKALLQDANLINGKVHTRDVADLLGVFEPVVVARYVETHPERELIKKEKTAGTYESLKWYTADPEKEGTK